MRNQILVSLVIGLIVTGCQQVDFGGGCGEINGYSFADMDSNRDGGIRAAEFKGGPVRQLSVQADFAVKACRPRSGSFAQVDADSDGTISQSEFDRYDS